MKLTKHGGITFVGARGCRRWWRVLRPRFERCVGKYRGESSWSFDWLGVAIWHHSFPPMTCGERGVW